MTNEKHLYMVVHPNHSLIASGLEPEHFAKHYVQGSTRYFEGRLIFVEVDPAYRHPYFDIDTALSQIIPHEDGRPKATKFIKSYRTLEHVDYSALGKLYVCNSLGEYVVLESAEYTPKVVGDGLDILLAINPIKMMVLTKFNFLEYAKYITDPQQPKGAPCMFYTQLDFNADDFLAEFDENPFIRCFVPGIHPARLRTAIQEIRNTPGKNVKGLSLDCPYDKISYKFLRRGFMFAAQSGYKYYPLKSLEEVEKNWYKFWKNM